MKRQIGFGVIAAAISVAMITPAAHSSILTSNLPAGYSTEFGVIVQFGQQCESELVAFSANEQSDLGNNSSLLKSTSDWGTGFLLSQLENSSCVVSIEPNVFVAPLGEPNDFYYSDQDMWGLGGPTASTTRLATSSTSRYGSNAIASWEAGYTGSDKVHIAVIDTGIDITHPDLQANIWTNPGEVADGNDTDGNGFIDDINGWDFKNGNNSVFDSVAGDFHGTHVAGTIGAVGNNTIGVVGMNWDVTIIPVKFLDETGGNLAGAIAAINYVTDLKVNRGINIVATNNSWGGNAGVESPALQEAIRAGGEAGIVFVAASGNAGTDVQADLDLPAGIDCAGGSMSWDCIISVASIDKTGELSSFSNFGASLVDLAAPGRDILSTIPVFIQGDIEFGYAFDSGTSMAAPHVTGAIALCSSVNSSLSGEQLRQKLLATTADNPALDGVVATGGHLDAGALVIDCASSAGGEVGPPAVAAAPTASSIATTAATISWSELKPSNAAVASFKLQRSVDSVWSDIDSGACAGDLDVSGDTCRLEGLSESTSYSLRLTASNTVGDTSSDVLTFTTATTPPPPPSTGPVLPPPPVVVEPTPATQPNQFLVDGEAVTITVSPLDTPGVEFEIAGSKVSIAGGYQAVDPSKLAARPGQSLKLDVDALKPESTFEISVTRQVEISPQFQVTNTTTDVYSTEIVVSESGEVSTDIDLASNLVSGEYLMVITGVSATDSGFSTGLELNIEEFDTSAAYWTKRTGNNVKVYAKNVIGVGKVQIFFNGNEIAWVRASSSSDPKLRVITEGPMTGAVYLVRDRDILPGKNVFEIYVDGVRVERRIASR